MKKPELSIIVPVYNGQDYIGRCMDSIIRQRDIDKCEIIIVNDGSKDDTGKILKKIAKEHKNMRIVSQANQGVSVARNNGIRASHGEYVTFVDCDDMVGLNIDAFEPYFMNGTHSEIGNMDISTVHTTLALFRPENFDDKYFVNMMNAANDTNADVILGGKITINRDSMYTRRHTYNQGKLYKTSPEDKHTVLRQAAVRENANFALYSRRLLNMNHLRFMANMKLDEDILFCMLAVLYSERVATVPNVTYFYNRHNDTLSNISNSQDRIKKYQTAHVQHYSYFLNELGRRPAYSKIFTYWVKEFSHKGADFLDYSGEFPPNQCYYFCDKDECKDCFIADAMRERFKDNITKHLGIKKR